MSGREYLIAFLSAFIFAVAGIGGGYYWALVSDRDAPISYGDQAPVADGEAPTDMGGGAMGGGATASVEDTSSPFGAGIDPALALAPLADVVDGAAPEIVDISHVDAVLVFRSTIPLACSVAYGKTPELGQIATDQDMAGGAIIDHNPVLSDLDADTEYFYRVQGTAADGSIYVGEVHSFRTAPEPSVDAAADGAEGSDLVDLGSLAVGGTVTLMSSNYGGAPNDGSWGVNQALDGNERTAWSSDGDGDDAYLVLRLSEPARVVVVEVWTRTMSDGTAQINSFTLTGDDGVAHGPFELPDASRAYRFEVDIETATLRFDVETSSGGNTGLVEFVVLGREL